VGEYPTNSTSSPATHHGVIAPESDPPVTMSCAAQQRCAVERIAAFKACNDALSAARAERQSHAAGPVHTCEPA